MLRSHGMTDQKAWEKACNHIAPTNCLPASPNLLKSTTRTPVTISRDEKTFTEDSKSSKRAVTLRIGVFFDGTGNNAANTELGIRCGAQFPIKSEDIEASCKPYMKSADSSYGNDYTNIKKLSDLYYDDKRRDPKDKSNLYHFPIYIEGIGTLSGEDDNLLGLGMGRGSTGVTGKVEIAFSRIKQIVNAFRLRYPDCEISNLKFDTFGFSRGAAAARHFANQVALGNTGPMKELVKSLPSAFSTFFDERYQYNVDVSFIGLFDTVPSIGGIDNLGYVRSAHAPGLKLYLPRSLFPNVVHLVARDEIRANFALSRVSPDHPEYVVPGAHSDIGGGYLDQAEECVLISPMQALDVSLTTNVEQTSIYKDAMDAREGWIKKGWPEDMLEIVTPPGVTLPRDSSDRYAPLKKRVYAGLQLKHIVSGALSKVYLRVMYKLAKEKGVKFNDIPNTYLFRVPEELVHIEDKFLAGDYSITKNEDKLLMLKYIHISANWNPPSALQGNTPRTGIPIKFVNAPTSDSIRVRHPHIADT